MATLHESAACNRNRIREAVTAEVCCGPMEGRRHSKEGPFSGLRTHWRAELAEAVSSVVGGGNNRSVSHVSQPQDGPEWVRNRDTLRFLNVRLDEDCCLRVKVSGVPSSDLHSEAFSTHRPEKCAKIGSGPMLSCATYPLLSASSFQCHRVNCKPKGDRTDTQPEP